VTNRVQLTPVAIHEAMCFVETAFKDNPTAPDHETIATAVFSQPEIGTVGLSEDDAAGLYPELEIYRASFRPMRNTLSGPRREDADEAGLSMPQRAGARRPHTRPGRGRDGATARHPLKAGVSKDDFDAPWPSTPPRRGLVTIVQGPLPGAERRARSTDPPAGPGQSSVPERISSATVK